MVRLSEAGSYTLRVVTPRNTITLDIVLAVIDPFLADFDESGGAPQVADIFAFLSAWFAGCP